MITCNQYDYIEIACLYHLPVRVTTDKGELYEGTATNTGYNQKKQECFILQVNGQERWIETSHLVEMQALQPNPHFDSVHFQKVS